MRKKAAHVPSLDLNKSCLMMESGWKSDGKIRGFEFSSLRCCLATPLLRGSYIDGHGLHEGFFSFLRNQPRPVMYLLINALTLSLFIYLLTVFRDHKRRRGLPYPPGPSSRPIIGNLLDIPKGASWVAYADMSKKYGRRGHSCKTCLHKLKSAFQGDVICFRVFSQVVVVLCSSSAIKDLLEKRGENYSERPTLPILEMYAQ